MALHVRRNAKTGNQPRPWSVAQSPIMERYYAVGRIFWFIRNKFAGSFYRPSLSYSWISASSSFPSVTTMSQKSSLMKTPQYVQGALTSDENGSHSCSASELANKTNSVFAPTANRADGRFPGSRVNTERSAFPECQNYPVAMHRTPARRLQLRGQPWPWSHASAETSPHSLFPQMRHRRRRR